MVVKKKAVRKKRVVKKRPVKKSSAKAYVTRKSQMTGKAPSARLKARRKKVVKKKVPGYFPNPIKGKKVATLYGVYISFNEDRYYYIGADTNGKPIFDSDVQKSLLSSKKTQFGNQIKKSVEKHFNKTQLQKVKLHIIKMYVASDGNIIPGE